jgi:anti-sigma factor RsiW
MSALSKEESSTERRRSIVERHEAIELLEPLVDGEVGGEKEREVREFLASDPDCRREYERLTALSFSLRENLPQLEAPPYLRRTVEEMGRRKTKQKLLLPSFFKNRWAQVIAACFAVAVFGLILLDRNPKGRLPLSLFVLDHMEYAQREEVAELKTGNLAELDDWFKARLPFTPQLPALPALLEGGRLCHIGEERVALAFYNWNGNRVSLFVGDGHSLDLRSIGGLSRLDRTSVSFGAERGHSAAVWTRSGLAYILVAGCPEEELKEFVEVWRSDDES